MPYRASDPKLPIPMIAVMLVLFARVSVLSAQIPFHAVARHSPNPDSGFNLDFENVSNGSPVPWGFVNAGNNEFQEAVDSSIAYSGVRSLRISSATAPSSDKGYAYQDIPATLLKGKTVHLSGAIRTSQNDNGFATIFVQVDEPTTGTVANLQPNAPTGTTDWQVYSISATLPDDVTDVLFGVTLHGSGTAWFDHLSIDVDGKPILVPAGQREERNDSAPF